MKLVDLNLLVYAVNSDSPHHAPARTWLEEALSGEEPVALAWAVVLGFLRLTTNGRVLTRPLTPEQALSVVDGWLQHPTVVTLEPTAEHWRTLRAILLEVGTAGNLTTDAHLAALAIGTGCELYSTDRDFGRFPGLRWRNPLVDEAPAD